MLSTQRGVYIAEVYYNMYISKNYIYIFFYMLQTPPSFPDPSSDVRYQDAGYSPMMALRGSLGWDELQRLLCEVCL